MQPAGLGAKCGNTGGDPTSPVSSCASRQLRSQHQSPEASGLASPRSIAQPQHSFDRGEDRTIAAAAAVGGSSGADKIPFGDWVVPILEEDITPALVGGDRGGTEDISTPALADEECGGTEEAGTLALLDEGSDGAAWDSPSSPMMPLGSAGWTP